MQTIDRNEIAKDINAKIAGLGRSIQTNWELGFEEGQIITLEKHEVGQTVVLLQYVMIVLLNIILKLKMKYLATLLIMKMK